jgi:sugar phosphate permease
MALSGFLFLSWRIFEILILIPIVGMLAYFVHGYVQSNQLTPNFILVLFIVSVLALAWALATLVNYLRARHDALFVAAVDLGFVGALIAGVVLLRGIAKSDCTNFSSGPLYVNLGVFGYYGRQSNSRWGLTINKTCAMLKASWALAIIAILAFFVTFVSCLIYHQHQSNVH